MIKVELKESEGSIEIEITENDRGEWYRNATLSAGEELVGFGGENALVIIPMSMQSGQWDVVVVHSCVDSPSRVGRWLSKDVNVALNEAIAQVCDYPEKL